LIEVVDFYADKENWHPSASLQFNYILPDDVDETSFSGVDFKGGKRAREIAKHEMYKKLKERV
jgi:hypothetical protein